MVLVVAGASLLLSTCGALLHVLLRLDHVGRSYLNDTATVSRLGKQFRQDVRTARGAGRGLEAENRLTLTSPDGPTITYEVEGDRLLRAETLGGKPVRRESFDVTRLGPVGFEADGPFRRLVLKRRPENLGKALRPALRIDALLGKHLPLASVSEAKR